MLSILLVEPHSDTLDLYTEFLSAKGFQVTGCDNTDDAFDLAHGADVVITGIRVNGAENGLGLVRRLRGDVVTRDLPIIVLSACAFESDEREAVDAGCSAYLAKPCLPLRLVDTVRAVLDPKAPQKRQAKVEDARRRRQKLA